MAKGKARTMVSMPQKDIITMATAARGLNRAIPHNPVSALRHASRRSRTPLNQVFNSSQRHYSSRPSPQTISTSLIVGGTAVATLVAGGFYYLNKKEVHAPASVPVPETLKKGSAGEKAGLFTPTREDYQHVYNAIAKQLWEKDEYDDGSYGPVLVRLAWHASGTFDAETGTGGSNGATMRFDPEGSHGANAGLKHARDFLEAIKEQFPWISYSDLWTLAGVCAIQEMQGPAVPWRPGRKDKDMSSCTPDGRLPDGSKDHSHIRAIFGRMGFNDQEMVALSGAHALGRCHAGRSGFEGPWTFSPTVVTNDYYKLLMEEKWGWKSWTGPKQYEDTKSKSLMMLPTDMALIQDQAFVPWVKKYADSSEAFFKDFSNVLCKLFELGVPFQTKPEDRMQFKIYEEENAPA